MLPTKRTQAFTPQSIADYQTLAAQEGALPPTLGDFLALLGPEGKGRHVERQAALSAAIRCLQAGHAARESIQLWLLVAYAPLLRELAGHYSQKGEQADVESTVIVAFLESIQGAPPARLHDAFLQKRILDDTRGRVRVHLGLRDYQQSTRIEVVEDDAVQGDRMPDEHVDGYDALLARIDDLPITHADRAMLISLYVYGYNMSELASHLEITPQAVKQRFDRLMKRIKKNFR